VVKNGLRVANASAVETELQKIDAPAVGNQSAGTDSDALVELKSRRQSNGLSKQSDADRKSWKRSRDQSYGHWKKEGFFFSSH
jgi:hypothetical protein